MNTKRIWYTKALSILNVSTWSLKYPLSRLSQLNPRFNFVSTMDPGNYLLVKIQVSIILRLDVSYLDMVPDCIGQRGPLQTFNKPEVQNYALHTLFLVLLINFGQLKVFCFLLLQLPLVLVLQHRCAVHTSDIVVLGATFHWFEHEYTSSLRFFVAWTDISSPLSDVFPLLAKLLGH